MCQLPDDPQELEFCNILLQALTCSLQTSWGLHALYSHRPVGMASSSNLLLTAYASVLLYCYTLDGWRCFPSAENPCRFMLRSRILAEVRDRSFSYTKSSNIITTNKEYIKKHYKFRPKSGRQAFSSEKESNEMERNEQLMETQQQKTVENVISLPRKCNDLRTL